MSNIVEEFLEPIRAPDFPCVGAKSALAKGLLKVTTARDLTSAWNDVAIQTGLMEWAWDYRRQAPDRDGRGDLRSFAVVFEGPLDLSEAAFEEAMWERIQSLADKDAWRGQPLDRSTSGDPEDPKFSVSFGGEAFFVVGLHPHASRPARRFSRPAMVFNLHDQFERLREQGRYERMREAILQRDLELAGDINPMLVRHGEASAAPQYSGRQVGADWVCPFRDPRA